MSVVPLTHHEILSLIAPLVRRGRQIDLAASERAERRLRFKPVEHADDGPGRPAFTEVLQLEHPRGGRFTLTRLLTLRPASHDGLHEVLQDGLQARLEGEGDDLDALLDATEAIDLRQQFSVAPGYAIARCHRLDPGIGSSAKVGPGTPRIMTSATARVGGLTLALRVPRVQGIPAEIEVQAAPGDRLDLPEDLLAVLGWSWTRLTQAKTGWTAGMQLRSKGPERSQDAEAKLLRTVEHLAQTLAEPPRRFHERHRGARWVMVFRRLIPLLATLTMVAGAAYVPQLELAQDSVFRMLIFHLPPLLLAFFFTLRELPRIEFPPLPSASAAPAWRVGGTALAEVAPIRSLQGDALGAVQEK